MDFLAKLTESNEAGESPHRTRAHPPVGTSNSRVYIMGLWNNLPSPPTVSKHEPVALASGTPLCAKGCGLKCYKGCPLGATDGVGRCNINLYQICLVNIPTQLIITPNRGYLCGGVESESFLALFH